MEFTSGVTVRHPKPGIFPVQALRTKKDVDEKDLVLATSALMALLLFKNWQRLGAAANLTVQEYNEATEVQVGEKELTVLRVKDHKTGVKGAAKLSLERGDAKRMARYYRWIRPQLDPTGTAQAKKSKKFRWPTRALLQK